MSWPCTGEPCPGGAWCGRTVCRLDHEVRALEHYRTEGTPLRMTAGGEPRLDMRRARWDGSPGQAGGQDGMRDEGHI